MFGCVEPKQFTDPRFRDTQIPRFRIRDVLREKKAPVLRTGDESH
jgi:hypothetical protein